MDERTMNERTNGGRFDLLGTFGKKLAIVDEKTTKPFDLHP